MHPFEKGPGDLPKGVRPHLDVRLKSGWRFDRRRRALVSDSGRVVSLRKLLPSGARVLPMVPSLAEADPKRLSEDERLLARQIQVVIPADAEPANLANALRELDEIEQVTAAPRVSLP